MNQPPSGNNPWPAAPPSGASGPGHTQLGEPPPAALQASLPGWRAASGSPLGGGPRAGAPVSPTMTDPGLAQQPGGYGGGGGFGAAPGYGAQPYGSPFAGPPIPFAPARPAPKSS